MNANTIVLDEARNKDWEAIWELWDGFLENYTAFKTKKMRLRDENKYKLLSSPGPSQYYAFTQVFDFFKRESNIVKKMPDMLNTYNLVDIEKLAALPMLEFLEHLCSPSYNAKGKNIVMSSGSFWRQNPKTSAEVISYLEKLYEKGASISIFTQANKSEAAITKISEPIKEASHFGLTKRIPIHFIKADNDYIKMEFPHTESTLFRLTMFLDIQGLQCELKQGKTTEKLSDFFDEMTKGVL